MPPVSSDVDPTLGVFHQSCPVALGAIQAASLPLRNGRAITPQPSGVRSTCAQARPFRGVRPRLLLDIRLDEPCYVPSLASAIRTARQNPKSGAGPDTQAVVER
jgi:hypothetical protein